MKTVGTLGPLSPIQYPKAIETARDRVVEAAQRWEAAPKLYKKIGELDILREAVRDLNALTAPAKEGSDGG